MMMNGLSLDAAMGLFIGFGALIMLINIPMVIFIYAHPYLRKQKEVVTIGFVCFADLINATGYFFAGIYRLDIIHDGKADVMWRSNYCLRATFLYIFIASYQLIGASTLTITIDRVIAVTVPLKYRLFTWRYAYFLVGTALILVGIGFFACVYFWHNMPATTVSILCYTSTSYGKQIFDYMINVRQFSTLASIVMYIPIALRVAHLRRKAMSQRSIAHGASPHKRLVKTTVLIGVTLICEIIFVAIPDLFLNLNLFGLKKYELVWYLMVISKGFINIFLYSFNHEDIKGALFSLLPKRLKIRLARKDVPRTLTDSDRI